MPPKRKKKESRGPNARERAFIRHLAGKELSATTLKEAYKLAGYSGRSDGGPQRLLAKPVIARAVRKLEAKADHQAILTLARVEAELARVGFAYVPEEAITGASKVAALAQLAKHLGVRERIEVSGSITIKADELAKHLSAEELEFLEGILERLAAPPGGRPGIGAGGEGATGP